MSREPMWDLPDPDERTLWRGERLPASFLYTVLFSAVVGLLVAGTVDLGRTSWQSPAGLAWGGSAAFLAIVGAIAVRRWTGTRLTISTLRARFDSGLLFRRDCEIPIAGLSSLTVRIRWWQRPLDLCDLLLRADRTILVLPSVQNGGDAVEALERLLAGRGLVLRSEYRDDAERMFLVEPRRDSDQPGIPEVAAGLPRSTSTVELEEKQARALWIVPGLVLITAVVLFLLLGHLRSAEIEYPTDDAIRPGGIRRPDPEIVAFMEREVMPFAREALGPVVGGRDQVTCETCHGENPEHRDWRMPAVRALPDPSVVHRISEDLRWSEGSVQTAVYGYLATPENQDTMKKMREIVLPGMARLLGRPEYDFTRSWEHNRRRFAFGCYDCHRINQPGSG